MSQLLTSSAESMPAQAARTWVSSAGPRQTAAVEKAIKALRWRGKTSLVLSGIVGGNEWRSEVVRGLIGAEVCPAAREAEQEIGERFAWTITAANYREIETALQSATVALVLPVIDERRTAAEEAERVSACSAQEQAESVRRAAVEQSREKVRALAPAWAEAAIIAEQEIDDSDSLSDYFAHRTGRHVLIGWRRGKREDFRQLRAAAGQFPETAHLAPGCDEFRLCGPDRRYLNSDGEPYGGAAVYPTEAAAQAAAERLGLAEYTIARESVEQRENYSMGGGNYLKAGSRHGSGWAVRSYSLGGLPHGEIEIGLPTEPAPDQSATRNVAAGLTGQNGATMSLNAEKGGVEIRFPAKPADEVLAPDQSATRNVAAGLTGQNGAVMSLNAEKGGVEIRFPAKPADEVLARLKGCGWRWSRFSGCWWSKDTSAARALAESICRTAAEPDGANGQESVDSSPAAAPVLTDGQRIAQALREKADTLELQIAQKQRPLSQNWTPKRGREFSSRYLDGENLRRCQTALRRLAERHEQGDCPAELRGLRSVAAVLPLVSHGTDSNGYYDVHSTGQYRDQSPTGRALQSLLDDSKTEADREAELQQKRADDLRRKEDELRRADIDGFFPTPERLGRELIDLADLAPGLSCLEPSAGLGSLAELVREQTGLPPICIERNFSLREILELKGFPVWPEGDFLQVGAVLQVDRVIMNPPFTRGADIDHVQHAWRFVKPGGRLVALVSAGSVQNTTRGQQFRGWLAEIGAEVSGPRPCEFTGAEAFRQTGVSVVIITADKPAG